MTDRYLHGYSLEVVHCHESYYLTTYWKQALLLSGLPPALMHPPIRGFFLTVVQRMVIDQNCL